MSVRSPREQAPLGSVYWMDSSKRRQALEWLERADLSPEERRTLETFAARYPADPHLTPQERRSLLAAYARLAGRLTREPSGGDHPAGTSP